jgi:hypothetical protein
MKRITEPEFWVTNITKRNVCLSDLRLVVPAYRSWNLLDSRHFSYNIDILLKSAESGSLFKKNSMIKVRQFAPEPIVKPGIYVSPAPLFIKKLSQQVMITLEPEPKYDDLDFDMEREEDLANELSDLESK